jgi:hypothetical protein
MNKNLLNFSLSFHSFNAPKTITHTPIILSEDMPRGKPKSNVSNRSTPYQTRQRTQSNRNEEIPVPRKKVIPVVHQKEVITINHPIDLSDFFFRR